MDTKELDHLKTVVNYLYNDERKHYECEGKPENHIFESVVALEEFVKRQS